MSASNLTGYGPRISLLFDGDEAVYHWRYYSAFRGMSARPRDSIDRADVGRLVNEKKQQVFESLCAWIELCDDQLYSLDDLREMMQEMVCSADESVYSKKLKCN